MNSAPDPAGHDSELQRLRQESTELRQELERFRALFDSLPVGIYRTTPDGEVLLANATVQQLLGSDGSTSLPDPNDAIRLPQIGCARDAFRETLEREGEVRGFEGELVRHSGRPIQIRENARVVRDDDGTPLYYECTLEDVSDRHQAEAALRESEERFRSVVEHSPAGVVLIDDHSHILYVNDETCAILGRPPSELVGHDFMPFLHPDDAEIAHDRYIRRQRGEMVPPRYEIKVSRSDGEVRNLTLSATTYWDSSGAARTVAQIVDITGRTRAEEALRDYAAELEIRNEELDAFADSVAHDLKNPLASIVGFAEAVLEAFGELTPDEIRRALHNIDRMGRKMDSILEALLLFARIRRTAVKPVPVDMGPIIDEVTHRLGEMMAASQTELILSSHWPMALGYGPWLEEVWANFIANAIAYGGTPPRVELGADLLPHSRIRFWVRDNGDGIPAKVQERLFQSFVQPGSPTGHGIGLSIARRIIEKLDGQVQVESTGETGKGSTFSFVLPAATLA